MLAVDRIGHTAHKVGASIRYTRLYHVLLRIAGYGLAHDPTVELHANLPAHASPKAESHVNNHRHYSGDKDDAGQDRPAQTAP